MKAPAVQRSLFLDPVRVSILHWHQIHTDLGQLGGASNARYVIADNGEEYIAKGPCLVNHDGRYVAANELLCAMLASVLRLPILDFCILERASDGEIFFGSSFMDGGSYYDTLTFEVFQKCENKEVIYDLVVFDAWLLNVDRHDQNLKARKVRPGRKRGATATASPEHHRLLLNDHSHSLMRPGITPSDLAKNPGEAVTRQHVAQIPFIANAIVERSPLDAAISACEAVTSDVVRALVRSIPDHFLPVDQRPNVEEFIITRQSMLRDLIGDGRSLFPNLEGAEQ